MKLSESFASSQVKGEAREGNRKRNADILHVAFPFGAHADLWSGSKRPGAQADELQRSRKISKALIKFQGSQGG